MAQNCKLPNKIFTVFRGDAHISSYIPILYVRIYRLSAKNRLHLRIRCMCIFSMYKPWILTSIQCNNLSYLLIKNSETYHLWTAPQALETIPLKKLSNIRPCQGQSHRDAEWYEAERRKGHQKPKQTISHSKKSAGGYRHNPWKIGFPKKERIIFPTIIFQKGTVCCKECRWNPFLFWGVGGYNLPILVSFKRMKPPKTSRSERHLGLKRAAGLKWRSQFWGW